MATKNNHRHPVGIDVGDNDDDDCDDTLVLRRPPFADCVCLADCLLGIMLVDCAGGGIRPSNMQHTTGQRRRGEKGGGEDGAIRLGGLFSDRKAKHHCFRSSNRVCMVWSPE